MAYHWQIDRSVLTMIPFAAVLGVVIAFFVEFVLWGLRTAQFFFSPFQELYWALPIIGGGIVTIMYLLCPLKRVEGLGDVQDFAHHNQAFHQRENSLNWKNGVFSALIHAVALLFSSFSGVLGPLVYLCASFSRLCILLFGNIPFFIERHALAAGAAAVVSVGLNAPLAGIFFAIEIILRQPRLSRILPIITAVIFATLADKLILSESFFFAQSSKDEQVFRDILTIRFYWEYGAIAVIGMMTGLLSAGFSHCSFWINFWLQKFFGVQSFMFACRTFFAGLGRSIILFLYPELFQAHLGLDSVYHLLDESLEALHRPFIFFLLVIAVLISLAGGYGTGVFAPSLMIGSLFGVQCWLIGQAYLGLGDEISVSAVYALVGLASFCAAMFGAPFFAIMLAFEISLSYTTTLAVVLACFIATEVMQTFCARSYLHHMRGNRR